MTKISIVIPVYNEKNYIEAVLRKIDSTNIADLKKEVIIVDDGSTDGTREILSRLQDRYLIIFHQVNQGKGAALRSGFAKASGEIIAIQDADLEYDPSDLAKLVRPIITGQSQVVYGSRMMGNNPIGHKRYYFGNKLITWSASLLYGRALTDLETCYKVFATSILDGLVLVQSDFAFEVEFTTSLLRRGVKIIELPISYHPRKFHQGKKINWRDGIKALWLLVKYRFK